jgi:hypothetical protein
VLRWTKSIKAHLAPIAPAEPVDDAVCTPAALWHTCRGLPTQPPFLIKQIIHIEPFKPSAKNFRLGGGVVFASCWDD